MDFVGKSVHDTIQMLLSLGEIKLAERLRTDYKVPDRHFWWLRLQTMAENGTWEELEKFAKSKKSPIGYEVSLIRLNIVRCRLPFFSALR